MYQFSYDPTTKESTYIGTAPDHCKDYLLSGIAKEADFLQLCIDRGHYMLSSVWGQLHVFPILCIHTELGIYHVRYPNPGLEQLHQDVLIQIGPLMKQAIVLHTSMAVLPDFDIDCRIRICAKHARVDRNMLHVASYRDSFVPRHLLPEMVPYAAIY